MNYNDHIPYVRLKLPCIYQVDREFIENKQFLGTKMRYSQLTKEYLLYDTLRSEKCCIDTVAQKSIIDKTANK